MHATGRIFGPAAIARHLNTNFATNEDGDDSGRQVTAQAVANAINKSLNKQGKYIYYNIGIFILFYL